MKLSEKGLSKLYNSKACYYDPDTEEEVVALSYFEHVFEFEPDDFEGIVCLSVEEAKALLFMSGIFSIEHYTPDRNKELLNNLYRQLLRQDFESTKKYFECFRKNENFRNEWKRIEQAEGKDE